MEHLRRGGAGREGWSASGGCVGARSSRPSNLLKGRPPEPGEWRKAGSRRPLFRKRPPLGRWGVTRKFAYASPSKAGLCPWPRVTGTDCVGAFQGNIFQSLGKSADFPLSALRAVRKKRHPAQSFARSRPGLRPSGGFVAHLAFDHQMTPALFAGASRASRSRPAHWRTGCRARLRRPSDLKHHAAPDCGEGEVELRAKAA